LLLYRRAGIWQLQRPPRFSCDI